MALWQDIRYAVRLLIKDRWFTAVAAIALALGIGANAAVFTFVNAVLLRGLPFDDAGRIVSIGSLDARGRNLGVSRLDFIDIREAARVVLRPHHVHAGRCQRRRRRQAARAIRRRLRVGQPVSDDRPAPGDRPGLLPTPTIARVRRRR